MSNLPLNLGDNRSLARRLVEALLGSAGVRLAGMVAAFLVGVQLARYLGPEQYGVYGVAMAVVTLLTTIATFGVPPLATREAAFASARRDWSGMRGILIWSTLSVALLSTLAVSSVTVIWPFLRLMPTSILTGVLAIVPLASLIMLFGALLRGLDRIVISQSFDAIFRPAIFSALLVLSLLISEGIEAPSALKLNALSACVTAALSGLWLYRAVPGQVWTETIRVESRNWIRSAIPMGLTDLLRALGGQFPILVLGALVTARDTGVFRVALSCVVLVALPHTLMSIVSPPMAATLHIKNDRRRMKLLVSWSALFSSSTTAVICAFLFVFGEPLIVFVFGTEYYGAWPILNILCIANLISAIFGISPAVLYAAGLERWVTVAFALSLATGLTLALALVPIIGGEGAAWAVAGAALINGSVLYVACKSRVGIDPSLFGAPHVLLDKKMTHS